MRTQVADSPHAMRISLSQSRYFSLAGCRCVAHRPLGRACGPWGSPMGLDPGVVGAGWRGRVARCSALVLRSAMTRAHRAEWRTLARYDIVPVRAGRNASRERVPACPQYMRSPARSARDQRVLGDDGQGKTNLLATIFDRAGGGPGGGDRLAAVRLAALGRRDLLRGQRSIVRAAGDAAAQNHDNSAARAPEYQGHELHLRRS